MMIQISLLPWDIGTSAFPEYFYSGIYVIFYITYSYWHDSSAKGIDFCHETEYFPHSHIRNKR